MSQIAVAAPAAAVPTLPVSRIAPWVLLVGLLAAVVLYFVSTEQGAVSILSGTDVHEWVHDARHLLGYPCH